MIPEKVQKEQLRSRITQIIHRLDKIWYTNIQVSKIIWLDTSRTSCLRNKKDYRYSIWLKKMTGIAKRGEKFLETMEYDYSIK